MSKNTKKILTKSSLEKNTPHTVWVGIFLIYNRFYNGRGTIVSQHALLALWKFPRPKLRQCGMSPKPIEYLVVGLVQQENNQHTWALLGYPFFTI